jgi:hypothetical protein
MPTARHAAELEGYLEGVARRLAERRRDGTPSPELEARWAEAKATFRRRDGEATDRILRGIDAELDALHVEQELTEIPRGLVGYTPKGDRGAPPGPEEEPLANRLRLLVRLAALRQASGHDVGAALAGLARAQAAYAAGDRVLARREADDAHRRLE